MLTEFLRLYSTPPTPKDDGQGFLNNSPVCLMQKASLKSQYPLTFLLLYESTVFPHFRSLSFYRCFHFP